MIPSNKNTSCKTCCFAEYDNVTQIGCKRNILDKYKANGASILECYDGDAEFYVIKDRKCPFFRTTQWLELAGDNVDKYLKYENQLRFHVLLIANDSIEDIKLSIDSIKKQSLSPTHCTVIRQKFNKSQPSEIVELFNEVDFSWRIQNEFTKLNLDNIIYNINRSEELPFLTILESGSTLRPLYLQDISNFTTEELKQFALIEDYHRYTIPWPVYKYWYLYGDQTKSVPENIKECQKNTKDKIVYSDSEVQFYMTNIQIGKWKY